MMRKEYVKLFWTWLSGPFFMNREKWKVVQERICYNFCRRLSKFSKGKKKEHSRSLGRGLEGCTKY